MNNIELLNETVEGFNGEFDFLSNMYPAECEHDGKVFKTSEHLYQWLKVPEQEGWWRDKIFDARHGGVAKRLVANEKCPHIIAKTDPEWDKFRLSIMDIALRAKFKDDTLRQKLIDTGTLKIVEHNVWGDQFWGVSSNGGKNLLGKMLMDLRTEFIYFM